MRLPQMRFTVRWLMAAVAIAALLLAPLAFLGDRSMTFEVVNQTSGTIRDVDVTVGGQLCHTGAMPPGASVLWVVRPTSYRYGTPFGLGLVIRFRDPAGQRQESSIAFGAVFDAREYYEPACRMEIWEVVQQVRGRSVTATPMHLSMVRDRVTPRWRRLVRTYLAFGR